MASRDEIEEISKRIRDIEIHTKVRNYDTFSVFPNLPLGLRHKTWRAALPFFSRIIEFQPLITIWDWDLLGLPPLIPYPRVEGKWHVRISSAPTLLSINQESRSELLPFHSAPFSPELYHRGESFDLMFSSQYDTVFLNSKICLASQQFKAMIERLWCVVGEKPSLSCLAVNERILETMSSGYKQLQEFKPFESLDELVFVRIDEGQVLMPSYLETRFSRDFLVLDQKLDEVRKASWVREARICDLRQEHSFGHWRVRERFEPLSW
ncbi:uncharacterized protein PAC_01453 [Phialocephala subalpina]|uniref:2EXR domain-containing protein n=1 Tax=Phialocephala subalpina TaxID=576137 RepID=A0A1L7WFN0_9HELO|nr:uncharacterized protein PAC_01453 [Phialocephala subalpina]